MDELAHMFGGCRVADPGPDFWSVVEYCNRFGTDEALCDLKLTQADCRRLLCDYGVFRNAFISLLGDGVWCDDMRFDAVSYALMRGRAYCEGLLCAGIAEGTRLASDAGSAAVPEGYIYYGLLEKSAKPVGSTCDIGTS